METRIFVTGGEDGERAEFAARIAERAILPLLAVDQLEEMGDDVIWTPWVSEAGILETQEQRDLIADAAGQLVLLERPPLLVFDRSYHSRISTELALCRGIYRPGSGSNVYRLDSSDADMERYLDTVIPIDQWFK